MKIKANNVKNTSMTTIGIAGAGPGAGATHMTIAFASKLCTAGYKVAVLEDDFKDAYKDMAEELGCPVNNGRFSYMGVDYYCYDKPRKLAGINQRSYDYLIVDMGNYEDCDKDFFALSNFRLIISTARPWKSTALYDHVISRADEDILTTYQYLFLYSAGDKEFQKTCLAAMDPIDSIVFTGFIPDPFKNVDFPEINEILGSEVVAEETGAPKRTGFFGGFGKKKINSEDVTKDLEIQEEKDNSTNNPNAGRKVFYMDDNGAIYDEDGAEMEIPELRYGGVSEPAPAPEPIPEPEPVYKPTPRPAETERYERIKKETPVPAPEPVPEPEIKPEPIDTRLFIPESGRESQDMFDSVRPNVKFKDEELVSKIFGNNGGSAVQIMQRQLQCAVVPLFRANFATTPAEDGSSVMISLEKGVWTQYKDRIDVKVKDIMEEYL